MSLVPGTRSFAHSRYQMIRGGKKVLLYTGDLHIGKCCLFHNISPDNFQTRLRVDLLYVWRLASKRGMNGDWSGPSGSFITVGGKNRDCP
jgi:hypothetical protein